MFCCQKPGDLDQPAFEATPQKNDDGVRMATNLQDNNYGKKYYYAVSLNFIRKYKWNSGIS